MKIIDYVAASRPPHRLARLRAWMEDLDVDACLISGAENVTHLCGYHRIDGGPTALIVGRSGERTLVALIDEVPVALELAEAEEVLGYGERGFGINLDPLPELAATVATLPAVRSARRLGISDTGNRLGSLVMSLCDGEAVAATEELARIRLVRDEDELVRSLHAYELSWIAQDAVARTAAPGVSEIEIYDAARSAAELANRDPIEFFADLLSGPRTSLVGAPAGIAGARIVESGDPVIADIVVRAGGYGGDTAHTYIVGQNDEIASVREELLRIREECAAELRPGTTGAEIFAAMRERVFSIYPDGEMPHHAGHGVAITAFSDPHMVPGDETPLESWMLIALEPGVYWQGRSGARVENCYLVTPDGGVELRDACGAR